MTCFPLLRIAVLFSVLPPTLCAAQSPDFETWNAKAQTTYLWQAKAPFSAAYSGANSLSPEREKSYSFTATAAFGVRPWTSGELYLNPEVTQGVALSNLTGLGGFSNGEMARTSGPNPIFYRARLFLRQTWGYGGGSEALGSDMNQLAGSVDKRRLVLTAGNLSVLDIFDKNTYNHDARTQFMNWALMTHGAYDYAADSRGYSWGAALEYFHDDWAIRAGRFIQPKQPNQKSLDENILQHYGDQIELERAHSLNDQPGKLRFLYFRNRALMSRYRDALDLGAQTGSAPDINAVRSGEQIKQGIGLNLEQAINNDLGIFVRASWADGQTETYAFTEIDRSLSFGALAKGGAWRRNDDSFGLAYARNALSAERRAYLAAGGISFFIGDGKLNYRDESILEIFYSLGLLKGTWLSFDAQRISNPAYNADRGPANFAGVRLHAEF